MILVKMPWFLKGPKSPEEGGRKKKKKHSSVLNTLFKTVTDIAQPLMVKKRTFTYLLLLNQTTFILSKKKKKHWLNLSNENTGIKKSFHI